MQNGIRLTNDPDRIVVIGDVHGDFGLLLLLLKDCAKVIDSKGKWLPNNSTYVMLLGDTLDRQRPGLDSVGEVMGEELFIHLFLNNLQRQARTQGGRMIKLLGNHEEMNLMGDYTFATPMGQALRKLLPLRPGSAFSRLVYTKQDTYAFAQLGPYFFIHGGLGGLTKRDIMRLPLCNRAAKLWFREGNRHNNSLKVVTNMLWDRDYTLGKHCNRNSLHHTFMMIGQMSGVVPSTVFSGHSVTWENVAPDSRPFDRVLSREPTTTIFGLSQTRSNLKKMGINFSCDGRVGRMDNGASRGMGSDSFASRLPQVLVIERDPGRRKGFDRFLVVRHNTGLLHQRYKCLHPSMNVPAIANILREELRLS